MKRLLLVSAAGLLLAAGGPAKSFLTVAPPLDFGAASPPRGHAKTDPAARSGGYTAAPTPNPDVLAPAQPPPSQDASLSPGFFTRKTQTQGDGYLPSSSLQSETNSKARPGAGINLSMPLQ